MADHFAVRPFQKVVLIVAGIRGRSLFSCNNLPFTLWLRSNVWNSSTSCLCINVGLELMLWTLRLDPARFSPVLACSEHVRPSAHETMLLAGSWTYIYVSQWASLLLCESMLLCKSNVLWQPSSTRWGAQALLSMIQGRAPRNENNNSRRST